MSEKGRAQDSTTPRPQREPWPVELQVLDQVLAEGLLDREWLAQVLRRDPYGERETGAERPPEMVARWCEMLLDGEQRREAFDRLALSQELDMAARYVLVGLEEVEAEQVIARLSDAVEAGEVRVTGALALLGQLAQGEEVVAAGLMDRLLGGLSERGVDVWGSHESGGRR